MFRGKGRNRTLNIGTGIGIIEESVYGRSKVEKGGERRNREEEREGGGSWKRIGRKGGVLRSSYDGSGVRHLTEGGEGES